MRALVAWVLFFCTAALAADSSQLDAIFAPLADANSPGLAVFIRKGAHTLFERGYGVRDLRTKAPIDAKTDFRLASFTKQFTAMAVMLLVHDGKLRYDDPITQIFPEFPSYGRAITIRHLLTHTSGLPDYEDLMDGGPWTADRQIRDDEVLTLLEQQQKTKFAPGTSWSYSNSGYVLLGLIVAKASGVSFGEFLQGRIFAPLGMQHTLVYVRGRNTVPNRAFGHTKGSSGFTEADQSSTSATQGDGGIYSNLEDLAKWDRALENYTLLGATEMPPALTPVRLADGSQPRWPQTPGDDNLDPGQPVNYGFGWFLDLFAGRERMWHWGSTRGFSTAIERFPSEKLTIVVLCNRTDLEARKLALQAAELLQ